MMKIMMISTTIFKNVIEKLQKITFFLLHNFGGVIAAQGAICCPSLKERCYKIAIDHI